jgi:hypothetical protein
VYLNAHSVKKWKLFKYKEVDQTPSVSCIVFSLYPVYKDFFFLQSYTMTLNFHQLPWIKVMIKVMALPWVQCNNSVKYHSKSWTVKSYGLDNVKNHYVYSDLDLLIMVLTLPWVQFNNSVKYMYYSNPCFQWKLMAQTMFKPLWA